MTIGDIVILGLGVAFGAYTYMMMARKPLFAKHARKPRRPQS